MKILKLITTAALLFTMIFSCKKTSTEPLLPLNAQNKGVSIKNGLVYFDKVASYNQIIENKNGEEITLLNSLKSKNFASLRFNKTQIASNSIVTNSISQLLNNFDSSLYTTFLLDVLSPDKTFSLNGFWIKVDMDNGFCSFIDSYTNPNGYQDLVNNNFANTEIHIFYDSDEPVLLVLEKIRNGDIDWNGYQTELSRKNSNPGGICLKRGAASASVTKVYHDFPGGITPGGDIVANVMYKKNFLSFSLSFESRIRKLGFSQETRCDKESSLRVNYIYEFSTPCKAHVWSGNEWLDTRDEPCVKISKVLYSAGTPLSMRKLIVYAYGRFGTYSSNLSDYICTNFTNGNVPVSIGY